MMGSLSYFMNPIIQKNDKLNQAYITEVEKLHGDEMGRRAVRKHMETAKTQWGGHSTTANAMPFCCSAAMKAELIADTTMIYSILSKIMSRYCQDPEYRKEFIFDPRVRELIALEDTCGEPFPFMRLDCLHDEETEELYFCEFNTDACGGMTDQKETLYAVQDTDSYKNFSKRYNILTDEDLPFHGWVSAFTSICRKNQIFDRLKAGEKPSMAIVVCFDSPNPDPSKLLEFVDLFERQGFSCSIFDVRELSFDGTNLWGNKAMAGLDHVKLDCIWKFCLLVDLLEHWDEVQPMIEAIKAKAVLSVAGFGTQIAHDKQVMAVMHRSVTKAFLTEEECDFIEKHIPYTALLSDRNLDLNAVKNEPENWILKPVNWYATKNVVSGNSCSSAEWTALIDEKLKLHQESSWIVQRFYHPRKAPVLPIYGNESDYTAAPKEYGTLFGVFLHNGAYGGTYLRQGPEDVIGDAHNGISAPLVWVKDEKE